MKKSIVQVTYRHVIDINSHTAFDKAIFAITWQEFLLKSQAYNPSNRFKTFSEMKKYDGRVNSLHYKIAIAATGLMDTLEGVNPYVVDYAAKNVFFSTYRFELLESSIDDKRKHMLAIYFSSPEWTLQTTAGDLLVLSDEQAGDDKMQASFMLRMEMNLYISGFKQAIAVPEKE